MLADIKPCPTACSKAWERLGMHIAQPTKVLGLLASSSYWCRFDHFTPCLNLARIPNTATHLMFLSEGKRSFLVLSEYMTLPCSQVLQADHYTLCIEHMRLPNVACLRPGGMSQLVAAYGVLLICAPSMHTNVQPLMHKPLAKLQCLASHHASAS